MATCVDGKSTREDFRMQDFKHKELNMDIDDTNYKMFDRKTCKFTFKVEDAGNATGPTQANVVILSSMLEGFKKGLSIPQKAEIKEKEDFEALAASKSVSVDTIC